MTVKLKRGLIFEGVLYRAGETLEIDAVGYSFNWLKKNGFIDDIAPPANDDDLVATDGLPPLDEQPKKKRNG